MVVSLSIAGCTSSTSSNQAAGNATTTTNATHTARATATAAPTVTPSATPVTPTTTPTPTATPTPAAQIPTTSDILAMPISAVKGPATGITFEVNAQGNGLAVPVSIFVNGNYVGTGMSIGGGGAGIFTFLTNGLPLGRTSVTVTFNGNTQYAPSTFTGYFNLVTTLNPTPTPTPTPRT
jgi:cytoskeletal protein RodZ